MLTEKHIEGSTQLKQGYGLLRAGELDHQDAGFDGGVKQGHAPQAPVYRTGGEIVSFEVVLSYATSGAVKVGLK